MKARQECVHLIDGGKWQTALPVELLRGTVGSSSLPQRTFVSWLQSVSIPRLWLHGFGDSVLSALGLLEVFVFTQCFCESERHRQTSSEDRLRRRVFKDDPF